MTGEISLRGLVLPVGGIREKMLAAKRAGITHALLPDLNRRDIEEIPPEARAGMHFDFLNTVDDALLLALESNGAGSGFDAPERPVADAIP
jgi:ATP-dependent Lon protease